MGMTTSIEGVKLIQQFEGFRAEPYLCPAKVATIGYGHAIVMNGAQLKGEKGLELARTLYPNPITKEYGEVMLRSDLIRYESYVNRITVPIHQLCFDALVSFTYNLGGGAFLKSTLFKRIQANQLVDAAEVFDWYNKAGKKVLEGLTRRRKAERALYERGLSDMGLLSPQNDA